MIHQTSHTHQAHGNMPVRLRLTQYWLRSQSSGSLLQDDFGNIINPMIVTGQVHGGLRKGEARSVDGKTVLKYDENGQLLVRHTWIMRCHVRLMCRSMRLITLANTPCDASLTHCWARKRLWRRLVPSVHHLCCQCGCRTRCNQRVIM